MSVPLRFPPDARAEYDDAVDWYADQRVSLGENFILKVRQTLKQIFDRPHMFPKILGDARKARVKGYPYVVIFQEMKDEIAIIAIFHTSRDPGQRQKRVST